MEEKTALDRIIAAISYLTFGFVGGIWWIICAIRNKYLSPFLKYHIIQSIFISFALYVASLILGMLIEILDIVPFVQILVRQLYFIFNTPVFMNYSVIQLFIYILWGYLALTSVLGMYSYVPWVSGIISEITGRK
ncbi:hypothetical protein J6S88_06735 [bacterium]|nr:hypothetical protein [bacterium]